VSRLEDGHAGEIPASDPAQPSFQLYSRDYVIVNVDPSSPALRTLGVTHALFHGTDVERRAFERLAHFEWIASVGENHLYRIPPPGS